MLPLAADVGARRAQLRHPAPHAAGCAQLRDARELVVGDGEAELQRLQRPVDRQAGVGEHPQVRHADRRGDPQLVGVAGPGIVVGRRVNRSDAHAGPLALARSQLAEDREVGGRSGARLPAEWVGAEAASHIVQRHGGAADQPVQFSYRLGCLRSGVERDRHSAQVDAVEHGCQVADGNPAVAADQPHRCDAVC